MLRPVQCVIDAGDVSLQGAQRVFNLLAKLVAGVVEGVGDGVAFGIGDTRQAMGCVIAVAQSGSVWQGRARQLAGVVVAVSSRSGGADC